jgi:amicyanin
MRERCVQAQGRLSTNFARIGGVIHIEFAEDPWTAIAAIAALALVVLLPAPGARAGTDHAVEITDFAFQPGTITITVGDTVTWTNRDPVVHTATSTAGAFDSGELGTGESYRVTFTEPGTFDYLCTPHPSMTGRIVVLAAPTPTAAPAGGAGEDGLPDVAIEPAEPPMHVAVGVFLILAAIALVARRPRSATSPRG